MPKRDRTDSLAYQQQVVAALNDMPTSPMKLNDDEQEIFNELISALPLVDITKARTRMVANVSRLIAVNMRAQKELSSDNLVVDSNNGPKSNPLIEIVTKTQTSITAQLRALGLSASQVDVRPDTRAKRKEKEREIMERKKKAGNVSLLAS